MKRLGPKKVCPACGERYDADDLFCAVDGLPLGVGERDPSFSGVDPYVGLELPGNVRLRSLVGAGSMGRVYGAFQSGVDRLVAVKVLHHQLARNPAISARFHREARIVSHLVHPNIVEVLMTGALDPGRGAGIGGELYLVMEYLDGHSLLSALAAAGSRGGDALPLSRTLHVALQLTAAIGEAHAQGVVHRDLKPENIMLVRRGEDPDFVKVLDFGIARQDFAQPGGTEAGLIFGTARYISPEGAEGQRVGPPADVYSIATMLYECLSGQAPFEDASPLSLLMHQSQSPPPDLRALPTARHVPEPIAALIMTNLSKDPRDRAEDARALRRDLIAAIRMSGLIAHGLGRDAARGLLSANVSKRRLDRTGEHAPQPEVRAATDPIMKTECGESRSAKATQAVESAHDSEASPTTRGHLVGESLASASAGLMTGSRRRTRASGVALGVLGVVVVAALSLCAARLWAPRPAASERVRDKLYAQAQEAPSATASTSTPGANVGEVARYPVDDRFASVRKEAAAVLESDAAHRREEGSPEDAARLTRLAVELDPSLAVPREVEEAATPSAWSTTRPPPPTATKAVIVAPPQRIGTVSAWPVRAPRAAVAPAPVRTADGKAPSSAAVAVLPTEAPQLPASANVTAMRPWL